MIVSVSINRQSLAHQLESELTPPNRWQIWPPGMAMAFCGRLLDHDSPGYLHLCLLPRHATNDTGVLLDSRREGAGSGTSKPSSRAHSRRRHQVFLQAHLLDLAYLRLLLHLDNGI